MFKKAMSVVLGLAMTVGCIFPMQVVTAFAAEETQEQQTLTIPVTQLEGETNKFIFAPGK